MSLFGSASLIVCTTGTEGGIQTVVYPRMSQNEARSPTMALSFSATDDFHEALSLAKDDARREILLRRALQKREDEKRMWLDMPIPDPLGAIKADVAMAAYHIELHNMLTALDKLLEVRSSPFIDNIVHEAVEINLLAFWEMWRKCVNSAAGAPGAPLMACSNPMRDEEVAQLRAFWVYYNSLVPSV